MASVDNKQQPGSGAKKPVAGAGADRLEKPLPAGSAAAKTGSGEGGGDNIDFILDIPLEIRVELGRTNMVIDDLLKLGQGSVIELQKLAGETLEIMANQRLIAKGEVVVMNEKYGVRLTEIISPSERIETLK